MKKFILTGLMLLSTQAFSQAVKEYDETQEKQCHQELKTLGCVKSNGDQDSTCAENIKAKLSKLCASMHEEKKS